jgi:glucose-6-phosphate 1-epimerase
LGGHTLQNFPLSPSPPRCPAPTMPITLTTHNTLPALRIANALGEAVVCLHGAHVVHFQPTGQAPVLWMSDASFFAEGRSIRGGVPVCAPWFGPHATDAKLPAHGLLRTRVWTQTAAGESADGSSWVTLSLMANPEMLASWPHAFSAALTVIVGTSLSLELAIRNTGTAPFLLGEALHTYFAVSDIRNIRLSGLTGATFIDKLDGNARKVQGPEPITFTGQTDRVYLASEDAVVIEDPGFKRRIVVQKSGSGATVVWNPWLEKAAAMVDFGDHEWPGMVCVEAANAADSTVVVPPNFTHHLSQVIALG